MQGSRRTAGSRAHLSLLPPAGESPLVGVHPTPVVVGTSPDLRLSFASKARQNSGSQALSHGAAVFAVLHFAGLVFGGGVVIALRALGVIS